MKSDLKSKLILFLIIGSIMLNVLAVFLMVDDWCLIRENRIYEDELNVRDIYLEKRNLVSDFTLFYAKWLEDKQDKKEGK